MIDDDENLLCTSLSSFLSLTLLLPSLTPFLSLPLSHSFLLLVPSFAPSLACLLLSSPPSFLPLSPFSLPHFPSHPLPFHTHASPPLPSLIPSFPRLPSHTPPQLAEMRAEYQRENEDILDNIRQIAKEVRLQALVMDHSIPLEYQVTNSTHSALSASQMRSYR